MGSWAGCELALCEGGPAVEQPGDDHPIWQCTKHSLCGQGVSQPSAQVGRLWTSLADYYIRRGMYETARDVYEEGLTTVVTVRDFSLIFDTLTQARRTPYPTGFEHRFGLRASAPPRSPCATSPSSSTRPPRRAAPQHYASAAPLGCWLGLPALAPARPPCAALIFNTLTQARTQAEGWVQGLASVFSRLAADACLPRCQAGDHNAQGSVSQAGRSETRCPPCPEQCCCQLARLCRCLCVHQAAFSGLLTSHACPAVRGEPPGAPDPELGRARGGAPEWGRRGRHGLCAEGRRRRHRAQARLVAHQLAWPAP